jgi:hypothetical protein
MHVCCIRKLGKKEETYTCYNKKSALNIIEMLREMAAKKGERLIIYAHNMEYDYIVLGEHEIAENEVFSTNPFIANTWNEKKNTIKWLCSYGLSRKSLEELGEELGEKKGKTPKWLTDGTATLTKKQLELTIKYCHQDLKVLETFYLRLKNLMEKRGMDTRYMITTSQISMQAFLDQLIKKEEPLPYDKDKGQHWFESIKFKRLYKEKFRHKIHEGCRGGRCEAYHLGEHKNITRIDANSLYPYLCETGEFPDLATADYYHLPLQKKLEPEFLFSQMGMSRCIIEAPIGLNYGYLPVRTTFEGDEYTEYPLSTKNNKVVLIGTWTHLELKKAITLGYKIHHIQWSIQYEKGKNPFQGYMSGLYAARIRSNDPFEKSFYKLLMNGCTGKFATSRNKRQYRVGTLRELPKLREEGWEAERHFPNGKVSFTKDLGIDRKRYYAPIWYAYITAMGRDFLFNHLVKLPPKKVHYCDTDGILCDTNTKEIGTFKYSKNLGEWKVEEKNAPLVIHGRKAMMHGEKITLNRVPKRAVNATTFASGIVTYEEPLTINTVYNNEGTLYQERNLVAQKKREEKRKNDEKQLYIDTHNKLEEEELEFLTEANIWENQHLETHSEHYLRS